jgi:hypothetical protein
MSKFPLDKGFQGFKSDEEEFLKPSNTNPYEQSASGVGFNAKFDDDAGTKDWAGYGVDGANDTEAFARPSWTGDVDAPHQGLGGLVDDVDGMGSGNKLTGGGGPLTKDYGVADGKPRYAAKNVGAAGQKNRDSRGGRDRTGGR